MRFLFLLGPSLFFFSKAKWSRSVEILFSDCLGSCRTEQTQLNAPTAPYQGPLPFSVSLVYNISSSLLCTKLVFSDYKPKKCRTWGDCGYQVGVRCVNRHCLYIGRSGWDEEDYQVIVRISNKARSSQSLVSDNENGRSSKAL